MKGEILRNELRSRHGDGCFVCGQPIRIWSYGQPVPDGAATIEHVHELREGGTWRRGNLALSHFRCNVMRSRYSLFVKRWGEQIGSRNPRWIMPAWPALEE